jgi:hypothetical protein
VWHHELLAAHAAGVQVLGASSMGALRAAELPGVVTPVGTIARRYLSGAWNDDAFVAVLHADAAGHHRALTVPHVNVWATARAAQRRGVLGAARARALLEASEGLFYQDRTWPSLLASLRWPRPALARLAAFLERGVVDLKADDARACLRRLQRAPRARASRAARFSSLVRRARLGPEAYPEGLADAGLRRLLLASFAKVAGLTASPGDQRAWQRRLPRAGWADDERAAAAEVLALEAMVLSAPGYFVADGPSRAEASRLEAMVARARRAGR